MQASSTQEAEAGGWGEAQPGLQIKTVYKHILKKKKVEVWNLNLMEIRFLKTVWNRWLDQKFNLILINFSSPLYKIEWRNQQRRVPGPMVSFICGDCIHILYLRISSKVSTGTLDSKCLNLAPPVCLSFIPSTVQMTTPSFNGQRLHWEVTFDAAIKTHIQCIARCVWLCFWCSTNVEKCPPPPTRTISPHLYCRPLSSLVFLLSVTHPAVSDHQNLKSAQT